MRVAQTVTYVGGFLCLLFAPVLMQAQVTIEYVAHACFVVQSPGGTRVVIDPYNGRRWLGYTFPPNVAADAVLITHPHYDHDAGYYWGADVPRFRLPGRYAIGDVQVEGIRGKHADPYGTDFGQINTIWVLAVGGLRIAHLGDNGPLTQADIHALGRVDVLMIPIDGQDHILSRDAVDAIRSALHPRVTVPMHYRIPSLSDLPKSLGPIDPWLAERRAVVRLASNRAALSSASLPRTEQVFVFRPSPAVQPWSESLRQAWAEAQAARALQENNSPGVSREAVEHWRRAAELTPGTVYFWRELARALNGAGQQEAAIRALERGLAGAGQTDWEHSMSARALLADLYRAAGNTQLAARQYRLILAWGYRSELRERAKAFLRIGASRD